MRDRVVSGWSDLALGLGFESTVRVRVRLGLG